MKIVFYGDPVLRETSKEVTEITKEVKKNLNEMLELMRESNGVGLAANQVGLTERYFVGEVDGKIKKIINPEIIEEKGIQECVEGCLSIPNKYGNTLRPKKVTIKALDENGKEITLTGRGEMAKCFCHEIDHLNGILFSDKVTKWLKLKDK